MNYQAIYNQTRQVVTQYRQELEDVWPTPPTLDCLKFAATEAAEVIDAELRNNPAYARNNDKELDPLDEVADCLMMLVSSMGNTGWTNPIRPKPNSINLLFVCAQSLYRASEVDEAWATIYAQQAITICIDLLGQDAPNRVEKRLIRIAAKVERASKYEPLEIK